MVSKELNPMWIDTKAGQAELSNSGQGNWQITLFLSQGEFVHSQNSCATHAERRRRGIPSWSKS